MFDIRNRTALSNIQDLFEDIPNVQSYNARSSASNNFYTKLSSKLSIQANSFSWIGACKSVERNTSSNKKSFEKCVKRKVKHSTFYVCKTLI